ncbi:MAG: TIM barrel protein [Candidatus Bathyarchaeia archaeon]
MKNDKIRFVHGNILWIMVQWSGFVGKRATSVETMSNFTRPLIEERENNLCMVKECIEMAKDLETKIVKVFACWRGTHRYDGVGYYDFGSRIHDFENNFVTESQRWRWAVEGIRDAAKWAKEYGITIALQNHPPVTEWGYEDVLQMAKEINMDNLKLCLDVSNFGPKQSDEYVHEAVEACKEIGIVLSHYSSLGFDETQSGQLVRKSWIFGHVNYPAYIKELKRIGFDGFITSEECGPVLVNHQYSGIETVDRHVRAALKYMKALVSTGKEPKIIKC